MQRFDVVNWLAALLFVVAILGLSNTPERDSGSAHPRTSAPATASVAGR